MNLLDRAMPLPRRVATLPERARSMSSSRLAGELLRNWEGVVRENEKHASLVSSSDLETWKSFERRFDAKIRDAVRRGDRGAALELARAMAQSSRKSAGELSPGPLRRTLARIGGSQ